MEDVAQSADRLVSELSQYVWYTDLVYKFMDRRLLIEGAIKGTIEVVPAQQELQLPNTTY